MSAVSRLDFARMLLGMGSGSWDTSMEWVRYNFS